MFTWGARLQHAGEGGGRGLARVGGAPAAREGGGQGPGTCEGDTCSKGRGWAGAWHVLGGHLQQGEGGGLAHVGAHLQQAGQGNR